MSIHVAFLDKWDKRKGTNLIQDEQQAVLVAELAQARQERGWWRQEAALAQDGLHDDRGRLAGRRLLLEQPLHGLQRAVAAAARAVRVVWRDVGLHLVGGTEELQNASQSGVTATQPWL